MFLLIAVLEIINRSIQQVHEAEDYQGHRIKTL